MSERRAGLAAFAEIDWRAPWLAPYAALGEPVQQAACASEAAYLETLNRIARAAGLRCGRGLPLRFVPQAELPDGTAYESHIAATGDVPTRHILHDAFNALAWFAFPRIKAALNARQAAALEVAGVGPARGGVRDALTLFDESAVLFVSADSTLSDALRGFDWPTLMRARREAWGAACETWLFGHALMEKLVRPYKACTAHAWIVDADAAFFKLDAPSRRAALDARIAEELGRAALGSRIFAPLPVLGVPGWWPANEDPAFYDDVQVFRRGRRR